MLKVKLSGTDKEALLDDEFAYLTEKAWYITQNGYAMQRYWDKETKTAKHRRMHRVVNATPEGLFTDHINGNKLDNRKANLRTVTLHENQLNRSNNKNSKFSYPGITLEPNGKYRARVQWRGRKINLGNFTTISDAIKAAKIKRQELGFYA